MFGKKFSEYVRFQRWILILVAAVFVIRLALSLSGMDFAQTRWISLNVVLLVGLIYCSIAVHTSRFGSYKQLYGLLLIQSAFAHFLIALGILLAVVTGIDNVYTVPEAFGGSDGKTVGHALLHVAGGLIFSVIVWLVGSAILFVTKMVKR